MPNIVKSKEIQYKFPQIELVAAELVNQVYNNKISNRFACSGYEPVAETSVGLAHKPEGQFENALYRLSRPIANILAPTTTVDFRKLALLHTAFAAHGAGSYMPAFKKWEVRQERQEGVIASNTKGSKQKRSKPEL